MSECHEQELQKGSAPAIPLFGIFANTSALRAWQIVAALSIMIRVVVWMLIRHAPMASDAGDYIQMAQQLVSGKAFVPYWPPGMPLILAPLLHLGVSTAALRIVPLFFWGLCCWSLYRLMQAMRLAGACWLVLLVFSLLPDAIHMSLEPMTQMPAAALLILALASTIRLIQRARSIPDMLLLGSSLGLLCLARPSTFILVLCLPLAVLLFSRNFVPTLVSLMLAAVLIGAWMQHAHAMTGRWIINTANSVNLFYGNNPWTPDYRTWYFGSHAKLGSPEISAFPAYAAQLKTVHRLPQLDRPAAFQKLAVDYVESNPGRFILRTANRIRAFFGFDTFTSAALNKTRWWHVRLIVPTLLLEASFFLLLIGPATFFLAGSSSPFWRQPSILILAGTVLLYGLPYWLTMSHPTYHFAVLLPLSVMGVAAWKGRAEHMHRTRGWIAIAILLAIQAEWVWQAAQSLRHG